MDDWLKQEKKERIKRRIATCFKFLFCGIYYILTSCIPIYVFYIVYCQKNLFIYSITIGFVSFIMMDIACSIIEDIFDKIGCGIRNIKVKRQEKIEEVKRKKEEELKEFEKLLLKKNNYEEEIRKAEENYSNFKDVIKKNKNKLPEEIYELLTETSQKVKQIIKVLKQDGEEYYSIRHTFTVYIPEFERVTYQFLDIVSGDSLEEVGKSEYIRFVTEFNKYLDFVKDQINISDKKSLQISINSLIKIMEDERKKGTTI